MIDCEERKIWPALRRRLGDVLRLLLWGGHLGLLCFGMSVLYARQIGAEYDGEDGYWMDRDDD